VEYDPPRFEPPYRVLLLAAAAQGWYQAPDDDARRRALDRLQEFLDGWARGGARLIGSFDDDFFIVGQPSSVGWSIFVLYEVDSLDVVAERIQSAREEIGGLRLDACFRMEAHVGRQLFLVDR